MAWPPWPPWPPPLLKGGFAQSGGDSSSVLVRIQSFTGKYADHLISNMISSAKNLFTGFCSVVFPFPAEFCLLSLSSIALPLESSNPLLVRSCPAVLVNGIISSLSKIIQYLYWVERVSIDIYEYIDTLVLQLSGKLEKIIINYIVFRVSKEFPQVSNHLKTQQKIEKGIMNILNISIFNHLIYPIYNFIILYIYDIYMTYIQHISTRSLQDSTELLTTPGFQGGSQVIDTLCQAIPGQHLRTNGNQRLNQREPMGTNCVGLGPIDPIGINWINEILWDSDLKITISLIYDQYVSAICGFL